MNYANYNEYSDDRTQVAVSGKPFYAASIGVLVGAPLAGAGYNQWGKKAYQDYGRNWASQDGMKGSIGKKWKGMEEMTGWKRAGQNVGGNLKGVVRDYATFTPGMIGKHFDTGGSISNHFGWKGTQHGTGREIQHIMGGSKYAARKTASRYLAPGLGTLFAISSMEQGMKDEGNLFGAYVGLGQEIGATVGARAGSMMGAGLGGLVGGVPGSYVGSAVGMLAGGYIGYQIAPTVMNVARAVRRWGTPETGGMFRENQMTQTMRQRSMLAIRTSKMNIRSELGRESQMLMGALY